MATLTVDLSEITGILEDIKASIATLSDQNPASQIESLTDSVNKIAEEILKIQKTAETGTSSSDTDTGASSSDTSSNTNTDTGASSSDTSSSDTSSNTNTDTGASSSDTSSSDTSSDTGTGTGTSSSDTGTSSSDTSSNDISATASNATELSKIVQLGGQVRLAPGNYGAVRFARLPKGTEIVSADKNNPAVFDHIHISNSDKLTLRNLKFTPSPSKSFYSGAIYLSECNDSIIDGVQIYGKERNDGDMDIWGGGVQSSTNVTFINSLISGGTKAFKYENCSYVTLRNLEIRYVNVDALNFGNTDHVTVEDCFFHDFKNIDQRHPDSIQFFSNENTPIVGVHLRRNVMLGSSTGHFQGFLIQDVSGGFYDMQWEDNILWGLLPNGLRVMGALESDPNGTDMEPGYIRHNTCIAHPKANYKFVRIEASPTSGINISDNIASKYALGTVLGENNKTAGYDEYVTYFAGGDKLNTNPDNLILEDFRSLASAGANVDNIAQWIKDAMIKNAT